LSSKNYKLSIQYDGSDFHGWQVQAQGRTVQGEIENVLSILFPGEKITLLGSGRTDAGVHALGLVANVKLSGKFSEIKLKDALNGNLDHDIYIDEVVIVEEDFHARFSAVSREYEYKFIKHFSPVMRNYSTLLSWNINMNLLNECAELLIGVHDFSLFCKANSEVKNKVCNVLESFWLELNGMLIFKIKANRFLQHMVRYLVGTMIEVPRACLTANEIAKKAEFFSFGTNDLTQTTYGFSRDDIGGFLPTYLETGILPKDPFQSLDQTGVGQLVEMGVKKGREVNENIKIGICGEHGGDPESIYFCHDTGLNYVSCSPFRVPIAILSAAQANLK